MKQKKHLRVRFVDRADQDYEANIYDEYLGERGNSPEGSVKENAAWEQYIASFGGTGEIAGRW